MKAYLIDKDENEYELKKLLSWDICHGLTDACDYFEISAVYDSSMLTKLQNAVRFKAENGDSTVFRGVVDEYIVSMNEKGATVTVNGRSLAALLMDNEVTKTTFFSMTKQYLVDTYVTPYGVGDIAAATLPALTMFPVKAGDSAWSVVKRFCLRSGKTEPRFSADGTLLLKETAGKTVSLDADKLAVSIKYRDKRYGIISHITVTNRATGGSYTLTNDDFVQRGGQSRRYLYTEKLENVISNPSDVSERFTGEYQIRCSERGKNCIEVTVPRQFFCFAGDTVSFSSSALGISGSFKALSTHCWADSVSAGTAVTLEV